MVADVPRDRASVAGGHRDRTTAMQSPLRASMRSLTDVQSFVDANQSALAALETAALDESASLFVLVSAHGGDRSTATTLYGSEDDAAAAARWPAERVIWAGAASEESAVGFCQLPRELVARILDVLWRSQSEFVTQTRDEEEGPCVKLSRQVPLAEATTLGSRWLPRDRPCLLLLKLRGEKGVRPINFIPDHATIRAKMLWASAPGRLLSLLNEQGVKLQKRLNLNEEMFPRYMHALHANGAALRAWHDDTLAPEDRRELQDELPLAALTLTR